MYNRYIHDAEGAFMRISEEDTPPAAFGPPPKSDAVPHPPANEQDFLRSILKRFGMERVDTGDLLLLLILFLVFREGESRDEELLIALGLLLIL